MNWPADAFRASPIRCTQEALRAILARRRHHSASSSRVTSSDESGCVCLCVPGQGGRTQCAAPRAPTASRLGVPPSGSHRALPNAQVRLLLRHRTPATWTTVYLSAGAAALLPASIHHACSRPAVFGTPALPAACSCVTLGTATPDATYIVDEGRTLLHPACAGPGYMCRS
jgi:hypothetical protein